MAPGARVLPRAFFPVPTILGNAVFDGLRHDSAVRLRQGGIDRPTAAARSGRASQGCPFGLIGVKRTCGPDYRFMGTIDWRYLCIVASADSSESDRVVRRIAIKAANKDFYKKSCLSHEVAARE